MPPRIASWTSLDRKAWAKPSRCRACSSVSMEKEMSTATTRARSTSVSVCAWAGRARSAQRQASPAARRVKPERTIGISLSGAGLVFEVCQLLKLRQGRVGTRGILRAEEIMGFHCSFRGALALHEIERRLEGAVGIQVRRIKGDGVGGGFQRSGAPVHVALVAAADVHEDGLVFRLLAPAQQFPVTASCPLLGGRGDEELYLRIGADHRSDVPPVEHRTRSLRAELALEGEKG